MPPETTKAPMDAQAFDALIARAGIPLTPAQRAAIHAVWGSVEAWRRQIRTPALAPEAEPATTFSAEGSR